MDTKEKEMPKEEKEKENTHSTGGSKKLYGVVLICLMSNLNIGQVLGFSAVLLPQLSAEKHVTNTEEGMIAGLSNIGQLLGSLAIGYLASAFGRKKTIILMSILTAAGFLATTVSAGTTWVLAIARVLQGCAIVCATVQMYISEISPSTLRAYLGALGTVGISLGITLVYLLGACFHWTYVSFICAQFPILVVFSFVFYCPESPSWYMLQDQHAAAEDTLRWLRRKNYNVSAELNVLEELAARKKNNKKISELWQLLLQPSTAARTLLLVALMVMMMTSGATVVVFYAVDILQDLSVMSDAYSAAIATSVCRLFGNILGMLMLRKICSKSQLLTISAALMGLAVLLLGLVMHYKEQMILLVGDTFLVVEALPVGCLVIFMVTFGMGPGTIPWSLQGELVSAEVAPLAGSISVAASLLSLLAFTTAHPFMQDALGLAGIFCVYAGISFIMAITSAIFLHDDKGKGFGALGNMRCWPEVKTKKISCCFGAQRDVETDLHQPA